MSIAVTGAAGYLGRLVTEELLTRDTQIIGFDITISDEMREYADDQDNLTLVQGDFTEFADLSEMIIDHDVTDIVQLAYFGVAKPGLMHAAAVQPYKASNTNVTGFNNVIEAARQLDIDSVVAASSTVVYGPPDYYSNLGIDIVDENSPMAPETMYGACKVMNEFIASHYRKQYGLDLCLIRLPLIYGPNRYRGAAPFIVELFNAAMEGGTVTLEDGGTEMDLLYEADIGPLFDEVLDADRYAHTSYNIVGHTTTKRELAELVADYGDSATDITVLEGSDPAAPSVDDSRFRRQFAFRPAYDVEDAVRDYLRSP